MHTDTWGVTRLSIQAVVSKYHLPLKGLFGKGADFKSEAENRREKRGTSRHTWKQGRYWRRGLMSTAQEPTGRNSHQPSDEVIGVAQTITNSPWGKQLGSFLLLKLQGLAPRLPERNETYVLRTPACRSGWQPYSHLKNPGATECYSAIAGTDRDTLSNRDGLLTPLSSERGQGRSEDVLYGPIFLYMEKIQL